MISSTDWHSPDNHLAIDPLKPESAAGLGEFLQSLGLTGLCLFQTSGSEGTPKWVALKKSGFLTSAAAVNAHFEVTAQDHWLIALPLHHVGGFSILARAHLSGSRVIHSLARWQPAEFAKLCREASITLVSLVPTQVHDLVRERVECPDGLRAVIVGGGGMSQSLADAAQALGWRVFQSYGMTEACSQIATQPYESFGSGFDVKTLEVLPHWQLRVDESETLYLKGESLAAGYAMRDHYGSWTWAAIPESGLKTRDRVRLWMHGTRQYLQFTGRASGYVKILGELVHLAPLQEQVETLARQLGWAQLPVLMPRPDPRAEIRLVLVTENPEADAIKLKALFHAASPPWLRIVEGVQVEAIPRSDLGKVRTEEVNRMLNAGLFLPLWKDSRF